MLNCNHYRIFWKNQFYKEKSIYFIFQAKTKIKRNEHKDENESCVLCEMELKRKTNWKKQKTGAIWRRNNGVEMVLVQKKRV